MRLPALSFIVVMLVTLSFGCNRAKSPAAAANDIAAAKQSAAQELADAYKDAAKDINGASKAMQDRSSELAESNAKAIYDVALARADGDHKVATQQCMTYDGDAQKQCKDRADADYEVAKANAKATRAPAQQ